MEGVEIFRERQEPVWGLEGCVECQKRGHKKKAQKKRTAQRVERKWALDERSERAAFEQLTTCNRYISHCNALSAAAPSSLAHPRRVVPLLSPVTVESKKYIRSSTLFGRICASIRSISYSSSRSFPERNLSIEPTPRRSAPRVDVFSSSSPRIFIGYFRFCFLCIETSQLPRLFIAD